MRRALWVGLAAGIIAGPGWTQPDSRTTLGAGNEYLAAGALAIQLGRYDEGIRLTLVGLDRYQPITRDRAAGLSNLCAAYAAQEELDRAIEYCDEALGLDPQNWHAYSNRSYVYMLKGMYAQATSDLDSAARLNPHAPQLVKIQGLINERTLKPRVIMEDHQ
jgi:tetratricopeptide (TPR) repeat protein